jgi:uncharacterized protein YjbJ (UPF0337 family)
MNLNKETIEGKWTEIKGELQKKWGKLTDQELEASKGDLKSISGIIQQKYGSTKEDFESSFNDLLNKFSKTKDNIMNRAVDKKDQATEHTKSKLNS